MAFDDGPEPIMHSGVHSIAFDPFRQDIDLDQAPFTSARQAGHTRPTLRRASTSRGSKQVPQDPGPSSARRKSKDSVYHPLKSNSVDFDRDGITRPQLERLVNGMDTWSLENEKSSANGEDEGDAHSEDERIVLVHQVSPGDSLPGVALKYGITMTELRRVNQLWSTDTIHLRKVLYIPLRDGVEQVAHPTPTVRRVPASRLSFFPPPTRSLGDLATPPPSPSPSPSRHVRAATSPQAPTPRTSTPQQRTLSTFLAALPMPARMSLDSSRSGSEEGMEHELDDVGRKGKGRLFQHAELPRPGERHGTGVLPYRFPTPPPPAPSFPRTVQLEPSPAMQLPSRSRKTKPKDEAVQATLVDYT